MSDIAVKVLACHQLIFSKCGTRERPCLTWKYSREENGGKDYSKMKTFMLFL